MQFDTSRQLLEKSEIHGIGRAFIHIKDQWAVLTQITTTKTYTITYTTYKLQSIFKGGKVVYIYGTAIL